MKEDIQAMLAEMRKRQLGGKKSIAEEEEEYENTNTHLYTGYLASHTQFTGVQLSAHQPTMVILVLE